MMVGHDLSIALRAVLRMTAMKSKRASSRPPAASSRSDDPTRYTPDYAWRRAAGPAARKGAEAMYCEDVPLSRVAETAGTPAYVYSRASIESAYSALARAFGSLPHTI